MIKLNKKIVAITLARKGSKKIKNKNRVIINGKPLIQYTIDEVKKSNYIDRYIVSTDDSEIVKICQENDVEYILRPESSDTETSADALAWVIKQLELDNVCSYVVEIMCTNPLKTVEDIDSFIKMMVLNNYSSCCSVIQLFDHHPRRIKTITTKYNPNDAIYDEILLDLDGWPEVPESGRQSLEPKVFIRNGSLYGFNISWFLYNSSLGYKKRYESGVTGAYIMPPERTINIDEPMDLKYAEFLIKERDERI